MVFFLSYIKIDVINKLFNIIPVGMGKTGNLHNLNIISYFAQNRAKMSGINGLITYNHLINMNFFGISSIVYNRHTIAV